MDWTKEEITEFDRLADLQCSSNQVARIEGRLSMQKFISDHGEEKCDAMWIHLESGGEKEASA